MSAHAPARSKTKDLVLRAAVCAVLLALLAAAGVWLNRPVPGQVPTSASQQVFVLGKVTAVLADDAVPDTTRAEGRRVGTQTLEVQILSGSHKGEIMQLDNHLSALFNVDVQPGSRVVLRLLTGEDGSYYASMFNYDRGIVMAGLALVFVGLLAALGGKKGLRALAGLVFTLVCVWWLLIPGLIRGLPAIPLTIFTTVVTAAAALLLLNGFSRKTACAVLGCAGGVVAAGLAAALAGWLTPMNGFMHAALCLIR